MTLQFLILVAGTLAFYAVYYLSRMAYHDITNPLRDLPGPKGGNLVVGHFRQLMQDFSLPDKWRDEFGANYQSKGFLNRRDLYTTDTRALNHILVNDHIYQKGPVAHKILTHVLGNGLLSVETAEHRRQNPAFGVPQIRALTGIFNLKSAQLRDILSREIEKNSRIDVFGWLRKMTLDVIGEAGFNYKFNALDPNGQINDLEDALTRLMHSPQAQRQTAMRLVQVQIPILRLLLLIGFSFGVLLTHTCIQPTPGGKIVSEARTKMGNIAKKLLSDSKADIKSGGVSTSQRDLLSLLVQSNMSSEIQEHQRLSDAEVVAQIPTFFVAGHESGTATALALHALSIHPSVQSKLREELFKIATEDTTIDELNSFPYLEKVLRETMRLYPPVGFSMREAMQDDVLPLSRSYLDRNAKSYDTIRVQKGTAIRIPISAVHRDTEVWGADAAVFKPERWDNIPERSGPIPSVWGNLMTFLAGPHNCIGFRFSLVEIKSLLFTLLRAFEFESAVPEDMIGFSAIPVRRPKVITEPEVGNQLPLIVRPYTTRVR
ncbi:cytochrome P450 [Mycena albidolilacea]|uniref:Cytochrome P450 n=1 Tax=Mycena albidolilacea TaxID=1033008 RepID=A0AAD6ZI13_9AGAR|nr:cytochrome P450 [Mycena albidolilacea]